MSFEPVEVVLVDTRAGSASPLTQEEADLLARWNSVYPLYPDAFPDVFHDPEYLPEADRQGLRMLENAAGGCYLPQRYFEGDTKNVQLVVFTPFPACFNCKAPAQHHTLEGACLFGPMKLSAREPS